MDNLPLILCMVLNGVGWLANGIIVYLILSKGNVKVKYRDKEIAVGEQAVKSAETHLHKDNEIILNKVGSLEKKVEKLLEEKNGKK